MEHVKQLFINPYLIIPIQGIPFRHWIELLHKKYLYLEKKELDKYLGKQRVTKGFISKAKQSQNKLKEECFPWLYVHNMLLWCLKESTNSQHGQRVNELNARLYWHYKATNVHTLLKNQCDNTNIQNFQVSRKAYECSLLTDIIYLFLLRASCW